MSTGVTELDRPVPLYMQIVRQIRAQIASGELRDGDRLPSQREMMARWHVSMQTASKVIGAMKTEGLAVPSVGRDTIVAPGAAARIAAAAQGTARTTAGPAQDPNRQIISVSASRTAAPGQVAEILGIPSGRRALRRTEIYGNDGQAVNIMTAWYTPAVAEQAPRLAEPEPLPAGTLAYIAQATAMRPGRVREENTAATADDDTAAALGIPTGSAVLITRTQHHDADGKLLQYAETITPAGHWRARDYVITRN